MSVTVLRAVSGRGAPRLVSPLIRSVPPPSIRHPPPEVVAVLTLEPLSASVPPPSLTMVALPAMTDATVAVTPESTL